MNVNAVTKSIIYRDPTLVSAAPAYTSGDCVGGARILTNVLRQPNVSGILSQVTVYDITGQKAPLAIFLFTELLDSTITDNAAINLGANDLLNKYIGRVDIAAGDYLATGPGWTATVTANLVVQGVGSNLTAAVVTTGTPTYSATNDCRINFHFLQD